jgi:hypothetical protein
MPDEFPRPIVICQDSKFMSADDRKVKKPKKKHKYRDAKNRGKNKYPPGAKPPRRRSDIPGFSKKRRRRNTDGI